MLIILNKSPFHTQYELFLEIAYRVARTEKVGILLIQDACIAATLGKYCEKAFDNAVDFYVLKEDCQTRGLLKKVLKNVKVVNYEGWVKLVMNEHNRVFS